MKKKLPLPVGTSDFKEVCQNYYYVDKTLFIKEFLDEGTTVSLFTRPRRFGKTLNMDMLRTFFEKNLLIPPYTFATKLFGHREKITHGIKENTL